MEQIKFRGRDFHCKKWMYGSLIQTCKGKCYIFLDDTPIDSENWADYNFIEVDPKTVGQFTGSLDKNGKEIYKDDIVVKNEYIWFYNNKPNYRGTVEWIYSQWQVVAHCVNPSKHGISDGINEGINDDGFEDGKNTDWEIIGNIHENPELLRGDDAGHEKH